jgi:hypothetical protein
LASNHKVVVGQWKTLQIAQRDDPLSYFVGVVSNSCFDQRARRQRVQPLGGGIGLYLDQPYESVSA